MVCHLNNKVSELYVCTSNLCTGQGGEIACKLELILVHVLSLRRKTHNQSYSIQLVQDMNGNYKIRIFLPSTEYSKCKFLNDHSE